MNRRVLRPVILSLVCALALVLIPMSYSWAQSSTNQQDQTQTDRNQADQRNQDVNQNTTQSQTTDQQTDQGREGLPATAGELPLLALIGVLSLAAAGSTRLFARAKSTR